MELKIVVLATSLFELAQSQKAVASLEQSQSEMQFAEEQKRGGKGPSTTEHSLNLS